MAKQPLEKNERLKRRFLDYRKYVRQLSDKTLDRELAALERFDVWNGRKDFEKFHIEWAMGSQVCMMLPHLMTVWFARAPT